MEQYLGHVQTLLHAQCLMGSPVLARKASILPTVLKSPDWPLGISFMLRRSGQNDDAADGFNGRHAYSAAKAAVTQIHQCGVFTGTTRPSVNSSLAGRTDPNHLRDLHPWPSLTFIPTVELLPTVQPRFLVTLQPYHLPCSRNPYIHQAVNKKRKYEEAIDETSSSQCLLVTPVPRTTWMDPRLYQTTL